MRLQSSKGAKATNRLNSCSIQLSVCTCIIIGFVQHNVDAACHATSTSWHVVRKNNQKKARFSMVSARVQLCSWRVIVE